MKRGNRWLRRCWNLPGAASTACGARGGAHAGIATQLCGEHDGAGFGDGLSGSAVAVHGDGAPDLSKAYATGIGEWDKVAIAWGYGAANQGDLLAKAHSRGLYSSQMRIHGRRGALIRRLIFGTTVRMRWMN